MADGEPPAADAGASLFDLDALLPPLTDAPPPPHPLATMSPFSDEFELLLRSMDAPAVSWDVPEGMEDAEAHGKGVGCTSSCSDEVGGGEERKDAAGASAAAAAAAVGADGASRVAIRRARALRNRASARRSRERKREREERKMRWMRGVEVENERLLKRTRALAERVRVLAMVARRWGGEGGADGEG